MKESKKEKAYFCPVELTLGIMGGKWKVLILYHLMANGTVRFGELRKILTSVTQQMLTSQLRELESDGIIKREVYPVVPPKVEYSLTTYGKTLIPMLEFMMAWGKKHEKMTKRPRKKINC